MQIDRIKIHNFKSIDDLDVNFQEMSGLWEISGVVGAGKTTIGEAIIFGLFGSVRGKNNENLISWGKKHALIETWIYCKNTHLYIKREINAYGQSPIICKVDGEELQGTNKRSLQSILENEWYDVPRNTIELLCVISFNNFKSLSTLNTQDSREFLNSTISFDKIDIYEEYCKNQIRNTNETIRKYEMDIKSFEGSLKALIESNPQKPKYDSIDEVEKIIKEYKKQLDDENAKYKKERKALESECKSQNSAIKKAVVTIQLLKGNLDKIKDGVCPVCGSKVTPEHIHELDVDIKSQQDIIEGMQKISDISEKKLRDFDDASNKTIKDINDKILQATVERTKTASYVDQIKTLETKKSKYQHDIQVLQQSISDLQKTNAQWDEMIEFIRNTVRPSIIASIVPNINKYIAKYLQSTHQNYIVYFDDNFKCVMTNPFGETIPISSLSTGQKKVIDMVIILAFVKTFVSQIEFNVFFMDELMGNIDADLRDIMCILLKETLDEHDVMFLISHSPINHQYIDGVIKVTRTQGLSHYSIENL